MGAIAAVNVGFGPETGFLKMNFSSGGHSYASSNFSSCTSFAKCSKACRISIWMPRNAVESAEFPRFRDVLKGSSMASRFIPSFDV
jgi:hypothetical protein